MRPVDKGAVPQINGINKTVSDYKDWRQDLINRIGNYCCYCNMVLNDSPQVEHVTPKNPQPGQTAGALLDWNNMLLACGPCNRAKDKNPNTAATHYMPDYHNTHLAFDYVIVDHPVNINQKACIPVPKTGVNAAKAQNAINLCKLNALTVNKRATDLRWKYRFETWLYANIEWRPAWDKFGYTIPGDFIPLLLTVAQAKGFFSIWFEVFYDVAIVKEALIDAFSGTHVGSFDRANGFEPVVRVAGDL